MEPESQHLDNNLVLHWILCKLHCDWFNKEADWPIAGQDKVRWENQTKDTGKKNKGVSRVSRDTERSKMNIPCSNKVPLYAQGR